MTEIPEHLRRRAAEARRNAESSKTNSSDVPSPGTDGSETKVPNELLDRATSAKQRGSTSVAVAPAVAVAAATATADLPVMSGPAGHTQRLLTVVKSGSIQDIKMKPLDKVHTWPHLIVVEFGAALFCTAFLLIFSIFVNAPLLELANANETPNPSKAPWYFLGMQELLTFFHPMVAGMTIPGIGLIILIMTPYIDKNPRNKPEDRKVAVTLFTVFMMFWAVLVLVGSFFRGPGFNFVFPWADGLFFEL